MITHPTASTCVCGDACDLQRWKNLMAIEFIIPGSCHPIQFEMHFIRDRFLWVLSLFGFQDSSLETCIAFQLFVVEKFPSCRSGPFTFLPFFLSLGYATTPGIWFQCADHSRNVRIGWRHAGVASMHVNKCGTQRNGLILLLLSMISCESSKNLW